MQCEKNVCGTGGNGTPLPGDPNNDSTITAKAAFGGIDIYWTYPSINPTAVARTKLFRGTTPLFSMAQELVTVSANYFFDKTTLTKPQEYFYWIQHLSLNGTIGREIGPASATAKPTIGEVIEQLTASIEASHLAQGLKEEIGKIDLNALAIDEEVLERAKTDDGLAASISELRAFTEGSNAILQEERLLQADVNQAMGQAVNTLQASFNQNSATFQTQLEVLAKADEALAKQIQTAQSQLGKDMASVQQSMQTSVKRVDDKLTDVAAQYMVKVQANGLVGGFGLYNDGKTIDAGFDVDRFWIGRAGVKSKPFIVDGQRVYIDSAVIREASIEQAKIGPFNIGDPKVRMPDGTPVTTASGLIRADAIDVGKLRVQEAARFNGDVSSPNYQPGRAGWMIRQNGFVEFNEAVIRGNLEVQSITVNGSSPFGGAGITTNGYNESTSSNNWRTTSRSLSQSRDASTSIGDMPEGSRVRLTPQLRDMIAETTGFWGYYYWTNPNTDASPERVNVTAAYNHEKTIRVRIWIDGSLKFDQSTRDGWGSNTQIEHRYDRRVRNSVIRCVVNVLARVTRIGGTPQNPITVSGPYMEARINIPSLLVSGDIFRLG